jgi:hypothetical protein
VGTADHLDEVAPDETGREVREHVGLDIAERRLRPVLDAVGERGEDLVLEVRPGVGGDHGVALGVGDSVVTDAERVELHPTRDQRDLRPHV